MCLPLNVQNRISGQTLTRQLLIQPEALLFPSSETFFATQTFHIQFHGNRTEQKQAENKNFAPKVGSHGAVDQRILRFTVRALWPKHIIVAHDRGSMLMTELASR